jgi:hypothetical protein
LIGNWVAGDLTYKGDLICGSQLGLASLNSNSGFMQRACPNNVVHEQYPGQCRVSAFQVQGDLVIGEDDETDDGHTQPDLFDAGPQEPLLALRHLQGGGQGERPIGVVQTVLISGQMPVETLALQDPDEEVADDDGVQFTGLMPVPNRHVR